MRVAVFAGIATALAGCVAPGDEVVGPFSGDTYRYVLTDVVLPQSSMHASELGGDLDDDGRRDNVLGYVMSSLLTQYGNVTKHGADMIAAGAIVSSLELVADDPQNDPSVGVRYLGTPDSPALELGGRLIDGWFRSNLIAHSTSRIPADLHLPVFTEADPSLIRATAIEIVLQPDGGGGFDATIHAAIAVDAHFQAQLYRGISQMIASDPGEHRTMLALFDTSKDGVVSYEEVTRNSLLLSFLAPDIELDGVPMLSFGFRARFRPCASEPCFGSVSFDHCFDRTLDGDETALDCGGSCQRCEPGATCVAATDCESGACDGGVCGPPSCTNGLADGFESDVDCGGASCTTRCDVGKKCYDDSDCRTGICGPCIDDPNDTWDCLFDDLGRSDVCYPLP